MAEKIFIADKPTLDATKTNTDVIKTDMQYVKENVKIDGVPNVINIAVGSSYTEILNVQGKGVITYAATHMASTSGHYFEITIDGIVNTLFLRNLGMANLGWKFNQQLIVKARYSANGTIPCELGYVLF